MRKSSLPYKTAAVIFEGTATRAAGGELISSPTSVRLVIGALLLIQFCSTLNG
jgi:hypothetical protein